MIQPFSKSIQKGLLAGAAAAALMLPLAGEALAGATAISSIQTSNAVLFHVDAAAGIPDAAGALAATVAANGTHITVTGTTTNVNATATLDGIGVNTGGIGTFDAPLACQGTSCGGIAANDYGKQAAPASNFARGDAQLVGAIVDGLPAPASDPASANVVGEVQLVGNGNGSAGASVGTIAGFDFIAATNDRLGFRFDAIPFLEVLLNADTGAGSFAQAGYSFNITIRDNTAGVDVLNWSPDGAGGIGTGTSISDTFDLTDSIAASNPGDTDARNAALSSFFFAAVSDPLTAGNEYTLNIAINATNVNAIKVPEPGILAMFGTGLLGLGLLARRRRRRAVA